jgi:hypothetical protein
VWLVDADQASELTSTPKDCERMHSRQRHVLDRNSHVGERGPESSQQGRFGRYDHVRTSLSQRDGDVGREPLRTPESERRHELENAELCRRTRRTVVIRCARNG